MTDLPLSILELGFGFLTFTPLLLVVQRQWQIAGREFMIEGK
jgi:hypothetical protein